MTRDSLRPSVSVIVPTHGRPAALALCLAALGAQNYPAQCFEVIVVDDGGSPPAGLVVDEFRDALHVRHLTQAHAGPARARNRGARAATGELLAFTDDDCRPDPGWLDRLVAALEQSPGAMVGGRVVNALPSNRCATASQLIVDAVYSYYNERSTRAQFCASNNLGVAREDFEAIGGFDERFTVLACEDRDLCDRWTHSGRTLAYAPDAVIRHAHAMGVAGFVRQHFAYGRGAHHYHRLRRARGSGRLSDDLLFYREAAPWFRTALRGRRPADAVATTGLLLVWQVANAAGFTYEAAVKTGYRGRAQAP